METIGEVSLTDIAVEWKIKELFSLSPEVGKSFDSPRFSFAGTSWFLRIYPNGTAGRTEGFLNLFLRNAISGPPICLDFDLGLKNNDGKINPEIIHNTYTFGKTDGYGKYEFIHRSQLLEKKSELMPSGILTLVCRIRYPTPPENSSKSFDRYCKCLTFNKLLRICKSVLI